jgi:hypothetical protein
MGGYGSGRSGGRATAEATASFVLGAAMFKRLDALGGRRGTVTFHFGEEKFPVELTVDATNPAGFFVELAHRTRDRTDPERTVRYRVDLVSTVPTFGGLRWWFRCPRTGGRVSKLYLPRGGWHFWSRAAYRLGYACQREGTWDRRCRRSSKLHRALGGDGDWNKPLPKPKWMRRRTYERKLAAFEQAQARADEEFIIKTGHLLGRLRRRDRRKGIWR